MYYNRLETVKSYFKETETKTIILTFRVIFKRLDEQNGVPKTVGIYYPSLKISD